jgi:uncharacterized damage-inducible protein DinB
MRRISPDYSLQLLCKLFDEAYDARAWHGQNLRGAVRRVDAATAAWRPGPGRKNIWEHVLHCAYWKYAIRRRMLGTARGSFPLKGSNWFVRPDPGMRTAVREKSWKADLRLLDDTHASLRAVLDDLAPDELGLIPPGCKLTHAESIYAIALHDVYHTGQVQLIKKLRTGKAGETDLREDQAS